MFHFGCELEERFRWRQQIRATVEQALNKAWTCKPNKKTQAGTEDRAPSTASSRCPLQAGWGAFLSPPCSPRQVEPPLQAGLLPWHTGCFWAEAEIVDPRGPWEGPSHSQFTKCFHLSLISICWLKKWTHSQVILPPSHYKELSKS